MRNPYLQCGLFLAKDNKLLQLCKFQSLLNESLTQASRMQLFKNELLEEIPSLSKILSSEFAYQTVRKPQIRNQNLLGAAAFGDS